MGKKGIVALAACMFALCLALVGCGGDNGATAKAAFTGTWDLVEMEQDNETTSADELALLKELGYEVYANLNEDGSAALVLFGEPLEGTWKASSTTEGTITLEGQDVNMSIADSKLTFEQNGAKLVFEKGEAKETPSGSSASTDSSGSEASADASASSSAASDSESSNSSASAS